MSVFINGTKLDKFYINGTLVENAFLNGVRILEPQGWGGYEDTLLNYIQNTIYKSSENTTAVNNKKQGLYLHNSSLTNGVKDNSYRFAGANPNNFVCFKKDAKSDGSCDVNNLYRIIGIIDGKIKLIKYSTARTGPWHTSSTTTFTNSAIETFINGDFLTSLGTISNSIANTTWKLGGITLNNWAYSNAKQIYDVENGASSTLSRKIGLMYIHDYMFASLPGTWTTTAGSYPSTDNWIWSQVYVYPWTITRYTTDSGKACYIEVSGIVYSVEMTNPILNCHPTFFLNTNVKVLNAGADNVGSMARPMILE